MQAVRLFAQGFPPIFRVTHDDRIPGDHLPDIRQYCLEQVDTLWEEVKRFDNPHKYYVDLSQKLWDVKHNLLEDMSR